MSEPRDAPKGAVVVVGSANVDLVMNPRDLPSPGVTVLAPSYKLLPGGKGANQAYACAKLGCESVRFIGATGDDDFSKLVLGNLEAAGVDVTGVAKRADHPTACASVVVDAQGENQICVGSGANAAVAADQLDGRIARGDVLLMQMEVPTPTLEACVAKAKACGAAVAVNVAPSANASAVGVDVSDGNPHGPSFEINADLLRHILKGAVAFVLVESRTGAFGGFVERRAVGEEEIPVAVVVVVDKRHTAAVDFKDGRRGLLAACHREVDSAYFRMVGKQVARTRRDNGEQE